MKASTLSIVLLASIALSGCNLFDDDDDDYSPPDNGGGDGTTETELRTLSSLQANADPAALIDITALQAQLKARFGDPDDDPVAVAETDTVTSLIGTP